MNTLLYNFGGSFFSPYLGSALLKIISNLAGVCLFLIHADDSFDLSTEGTAYGPTFKPLCTQQQTSLFYKQPKKFRLEELDVDPENLLISLFWMKYTWRDILSLKNFAYTYQAYMDFLGG